MCKESIWDSRICVPVVTQSSKTTTISWDISRGFINKRILYCYTRDYNLSCLNQLKMHHTIKHEWVRVSCQLCQYGAQNKAELAKQTNNMANISFAISQCEYKNRDNVNLNHHVKVEHGDIVYYFDQCDYEAKTRRLVGRHNKAKHDLVFPSLSLCEFKSVKLQSMFASSTRWNWLEIV